jgi:manganese-dependent ADP-ribose/CDP-alcohol diphosphatase
MHFHRLKLFAVVFLCLFFPFVSHSQKGKPVTIGIFTDCQYCDCETSGLRNYRLSLPKLDSCIRKFNALPLDAVFHIGDMIDHDFSSYDSILPRFREFKAPLHLVLGNHDYMIKSKHKPGLIQYLGVESPSGYYTVDLKNWRMIVLNGDDLSYFAPQTNKQKAERNEMVGDLYSSLKWNGMPWNGGIGREQMKWFEDQLVKAQAAGKNVIVFCHFPLFSKQDHMLYNNEEVFELLDKYHCVKAYFNGHYHSGGYLDINGIHMVNFHGMVNTSQNAFGVVTLTNDSILIQGYGREPSRRLGIRK